VSNVPENEDSTPTTPEVPATDTPVVSSPLDVHLEMYDGPLDLLLDLIRKQQIDIYDIPIARITSQYLEYMQKALELNIELSSEFVYMAATLIQIKSKMLLPRDPELEKISPEEDPRKELVDRLLEHERFKNAAEMLHQKRMIEEAIWSNPKTAEFLSEQDEQADLSVTLYDLVRTLQTILDRAKSRPVYEVGKEDITVPDMIRYLRRVLKEEISASSSVRASELFERQRSRRGMICLFLAILEMVRMQAVQLVQEEQFGDIGLKRHHKFEELFGSEQALAALEEEYA
jgi:segregation and condensation protein A